jgi:hypothetical protein
MALWAVEGTMQNDFLKETEALASRLELGNSDMQSRRIAEQDFRALGARFVANAIRMAASRAWRRLGVTLDRAPTENLSAEQGRNPV